MFGSCRVGVGRGSELLRRSEKVDIGAFFIVTRGFGDSTFSLEKNVFDARALVIMGYFGM
jgi:hypothetical protein